jgi:heme exporter protein A
MPVASLSANLESSRLASPRPAELAGVAPTAVHAAGLCKTIDDRPILRNVSFTLGSGSALVILGANGAGKSTLLRILAMLVPASEGRVQLFGQSTGRSAVGLRRRIGMIGHQAMLYRDLSAEENLLFFGRLYDVHAAPRRAGELLELVGLADRAGDPVKNLSRGQLQRVAIARALMHDPDLLLADEPFAGLDAPSTSFLEKFLRGLGTQGKTLIVTTHDIRQGLELAQHALVLRRGEVRLAAPTTQLDAATVLREVSP